MLKHPSSLLVIVDMQPTFRAANKSRVIKACIQEIEQAILQNNHILFLEYKDFGRTHKRLTDLVKDYSRAHFITKVRDDGSPEALAYCRRFYRRIPTNNVRICGVNTDACVMRTISGWASGTRYRSKITAVYDACDSESGKSRGFYDLIEKTYPLQSKNVIFFDRKNNTPTISA